MIFLFLNNIWLFEKKIFIVLILFVKIVENFWRDLFGIIKLKLLVDFFNWKVCWFIWCEFVVIVLKYLFWLIIKWIFVKIGWFFCWLVVKVVLLIIDFNSLVFNVNGVFVVIFCRWGYWLIFLFFKVIFDFLLVRIIWCCLIFVNFKVIFGKFEIILIKKLVFNKIEFGFVISKFVFLFEVGIVFLIEICLFDFVKMIVFLVIFILIVERIGIVFLWLIVCLVIVRVCKKKFLFIEKWIIVYFLYISINLVVIVGFVKVVNKYYNFSIYKENNLFIICGKVLYFFDIYL